MKKLSNQVIFMFEILTEATHCYKPKRVFFFLSTSWANVAKLEEKQIFDPP